MIEFTKKYQILVHTINNSLLIRSGISYELYPLRNKIEAGADLVRTITSLESITATYESNENG